MIDKTTRATAIVTCKKFYKEHTTLGPKVEKFALETLQKLQEPPEEEAENSTVGDGEEEPEELIEKELPDVAMTDVEKSADEKTEETSALEWKETDIIRHLEMYFSFCSKNHEFLDE